MTWVALMTLIVAGAVIAIIGIMLADLPGGGRPWDIEK